MPQYLSPGVYVEEVPSGASPIAGVGTSTAGFIGLVLDTTDVNGQARDILMPARPGQFERDAEGNIRLEEGAPVAVRYALAPVEEPQLITSWDSFKRNFGDFQPHNLVLAHAVYGFFNNGGTRCWVARVGALDAAGVGRALAKFAAIDEIALVAAPGALDAAIQGALLDHCENLGDRFAILDGQRAAVPTVVNIQGGVRRSNYAALYYPWLQVYDPASNTNIIVPPSGHMAGIYARVDTLRGVHKAPANEVVRGALDVEFRLGRPDQDGLNPDGINVIRRFDGTVTVWGARTLGGDANGEWKYINVRRLFLFLRESIDQGTQWVVFEPNEPSLWAKITRNVTAFLTTVWRDGALFGASPAEAFFVKCDAETNPPEVRDLGQVITEIGVAVVKPAEFVIFRISQWAGPAAS